ncbi:LLM class flavin-dependent oxidoreductase [Marinivivus vitaminiproducens]|uniref:LLM class flavin-dependent oxidoreductase n=1 Tax=Marinivivus vitaminiproducens TaxID=3035935 RepID=UPI0027A663B7|nr:LLM class flavin-dependent oxidoreductase [Geminicoccaceae bacterium SCSIO 64248]
MTGTFRLGFLTHLEADTDIRSLYRRFVDLFVLAEELGFDAGWVAQHHFEDGRSGPGAGASPLLFLTAVAERTQIIRLGTAVITVPLESPLRLAEDASTLDVLSGERVELGISSGYDPASFEAFGVSLADKREITSRGIARLYDALEGRSLRAAGDTRLQPFSPGLRQRVWQGIFSHEGARHAANAGSNLLLNRATYGYKERTDHVQRPWANSYLRAWQMNPANGGRSPRIGLSRLIYPARDKREARAHLEKGVLPFAAKMVAQGRFPAGLDIDGYLERLHAFYGHPDEIIEQLQDEQTLPIATDILCQVNPGVPTFDQTVRMMERIATEIAPTMGWTKRAAAKVVASNGTRNETGEQIRAQSDRA